MTVNYYRVDDTAKLRTALKRIYATPDRIGNYGSRAVFLERYKEDHDLCMMDFAQCTPQGPGHFSVAQRAIGDFNMADGDRFAENTAAILSRSVRHPYMAIEFKQTGVRHAGIADYVRDRAGVDVRIDPFFDPNVFDRFTGSSRHGKITFSVRDPSTFRDYNTDSVELNAAIGMAREADAGRITITLNYGSGKQRGGRLNIRSLVPFLRDSVGGLDELKVSVDEDGKMQALNLLNHLDRSIIDSRRLMLSNDDHGRYTYDSRIQSMQEEFEVWLSRR
jgi:hypothetical protein